MRFIVDECVGPAVARKLREQGHDVFSVYEQARGTDDDEVIARAYAEQRILVTNDKDFGQKVYRDKKLHSGIVLLRLRDQSAADPSPSGIPFPQDRGSFCHSHREPGAVRQTVTSQTENAVLYYGRRCLSG